MSRPLGDKEDTFKGVNQSGGDLNNARLIHVDGWVSAANVPSLRYALANGVRNSADGILISPGNSNPLGNLRTGRVYTEYVLEGINTVAAAVNDPVWLDPATPGTWTFTKPTAAGQDAQLVGRVLTSSATVGRIGFSFSPLISGAFGEAGGVSSTVLEDKPYHFIGHAGFGWVRISAAVTDGNRFVINGRVYEFDTDPAPGNIGVGADVRVGVNGVGPDQVNDAAGCEAALVSAINGDADAVVWAVALGGDGFVGLVAKVVDTPGNYAMSVGVAPTLSLSGAALVGGAAELPQELVWRNYALRAADITALAVALGTAEVPVATFPNLVSAPNIYSVQGLSAAGLSVNLDGVTFTVRQSGAGGNAFYVLCMAENPAGAVLSAGDRILAALSTQG